MSTLTQDPCPKAKHQLLKPKQMIGKNLQSAEIRYARKLEKKSKEARFHIYVEPLNHNVSDLVNDEYLLLSR